MCVTQNGVNSVCSTRHIFDGYKTNMNNIESVIYSTLSNKLSHQHTTTKEQYEIICERHIDIRQYVFSVDAVSWLTYI